MTHTTTSIEVTPIWADVQEALSDGRFRHFIALAIAKRLNLPLEKIETSTCPAYNLKANNNYAQSAEIGCGRVLTNPSYKLERFDNILHHSLTHDNKICIEVMPTV